jgi:hypothetical protein
VFHCVLAPLQCSLSSGWCELSIQEVHTWKENVKMIWHVLAKYALIKNLNV